MRYIGSRRRATSDELVPCQRCVDAVLDTMERLPSGVFGTFSGFVESRILEQSEQAQEDELCSIRAGLAETKALLANRQPR